MDTLGFYAIKPLPWNSATAADIIAAGRRRHHVSALVEFDVTLARDRIRAHREATGEKLSFTGWIACCVAKALTEHPGLNGARLGSRRQVFFDDVDVMVVVERDAGGERRPLPLVLRKVNEKSVAAISSEIRAAQQQPVGGNEFVVGSSRWSHWLARVPLGTTLYPLIPARVRGLFWDLLARDAFAAKRIMGTVGITAVGMMGRLPGWPLTVGVHTVRDFGALRRRGSREVNSSPFFSRDARAGAFMVAAPAGRRAAHGHPGPDRGG